jgi:hypothetical protein
MTDEAYFEPSGWINIQNMLQWSEVNPYELHFKPSHIHRERVWSVISALSVTGPYFSKGVSSEVIVTSDQYMHMVNEFLISELQCCAINHASI